MSKPPSTAAAVLRFLLGLACLATVVAALIYQARAPAPVSVWFFEKGRPPRKKPKK